MFPTATRRLRPGHDVQSQAVQVLEDRLVLHADLTMVLRELDAAPGIEVGESFEVDVNFRDIANDQALFAGYADIVFDPALFRVDGITHHSNYAAGRTGTIDNTAGLVNEAGASDGLSPPPLLTILTLNVTAIAAGTADFTSNVAEDVSSQVVSYDPQLQFDLRNDTNYGSVSVTVLGQDSPFVVSGPVGIIQDVRPTISWTAVDGALSYNLYVNIDGGGGNVFRQLEVSNTQTSLTIPQDLEFARYRVFIEANMPGGVVQNQDQGHTFVLEVQSQLTPIGATTATTPQFTWNRVPGASSYVIFINQPGSPITATVTDPGSGNTASHTITAALARNDYKWWVRPVRTVNSTPFLGPWSEASEFSTGGRTKVVSPLANSSVTSSTPNFSWNDVPGAQSYEVYVSKVGTPGALYRDAGITGKSISARVLADGDYKIWIRTTLANGSGVWGSGVDFTVASTITSLVTTPTSPQTPGFDATPAFTWQPTAGATTYDLYLHNGTSSILQTGLSGTTYTPNTALAAGAWEWSVRPANANGIGAWSAANQFSTNGLTSLTSPASNTSDTTPTFTWNPVSGAVSYSLQVDNRTTGTGNVIREDGLTGTSFTPTTALTAGTYRAWVRAVSNSTSGPWSALIDFVVAETDEPSTNDIADANETLLTTLRPLLEGGGPVEPTIIANAGIANSNETQTEDQTNKREAIAIAATAEESLSEIDDQFSAIDGILGSDDLL